MTTAYERFIAKVERIPGVDCWLWMGAVKDNGYGDFWLDGRVIGAHRASLILHGFTLLPHEHVCHRCDVRPCVNPGHLFAGTRQDNMQDAAKKGRLAHRGRKLSHEQAVVIQASNDNGKELAKNYGVSENIISRIRRGESYRTRPALCKTA